MARVLVADNDTDVNLLLTELLRSEGHEVVSVTDGVQALAALETPADLLICDLDMPALDGFGVLRRLAETDSPPQVMVVTGFADAVVDQQLAETGLVGRIWRKPFDLGEFLSGVAAALAPSGGAISRHAES